MSSATAAVDDLDAAIKIVTQHGIAPLKRATVRKPQDLTNYHYKTWAKRVTVAEHKAAELLRDKGAEIGFCPTSGTWIRFAGVKSSSASGLLQALKNWRTAATKAKQRKTV